MNERLKMIKEENEKMEQQKTLYESERTKAVEDLIKIERKLDQEIQLRLFFEQKLNNLHLINMESESKYSLTREKFEGLSVQNNKLMVEYSDKIKSNKTLTLYKQRTEDQIKNQKIIEKTDNIFSKVNQRNLDGLLYRISELT